MLYLVLNDAGNLFLRPFLMESLHFCLHYYSSKLLWGIGVLWTQFLVRGSRGFKRFGNVCI